MNKTKTEKITSVYEYSNMIDVYELKPTSKNSGVLTLSLNNEYIGMICISDIEEYIHNRREVKTSF